MTLFLIAAALLTAAALMFVLPTLLRSQGAASGRVAHDALNLAVLRDQSRELDADLAAGTIGQAAYGDARGELERRVAEDVQPVAPALAAPQQRKLALAIALALPALAAALYFLVGSPAALTPGPAAPAQQEGQGHEVTDEQIAAMVAGLAERLKKNPDDAEGWSMLARSYSAMNRFSESAEAYARLVKLVAPDAGMLADYADTLAMAQGKSLQGEPEKLVARALEADPRHVKAIALSGSAAFERGDYALAVAQWRKILALVPADSDIARSTNGSIEEARRQAEEAGKPVAAAAPDAATAAPAAAPGVAAAALTGSVELDPALRAKVADTDTVFIFARAAQGPRFPLAVLRKQVKDLPLSFALDDSMSMSPQAKLSGYAQVVVGARISKSGSATPAAGDLEGVTETVGPSAQGVKVRIDAERK